MGLWDLFMGLWDPFMGLWDLFITFSPNMKDVRFFGSLMMILMI